jgi:hypothetical protein
MINEKGINPAKLTSMIRYYLSELGALNAHHEFEHLARYLARARVAMNILPATGPVSSGGDGGRDFETYKTHHVKSAPVSSKFAARSTGQRSVVFACSLQKTIEAKIRKDVSNLIDVGGVDEIAYFCEASLPIAKRLKLIKEAETRDTVLQIFDGQAIAEMLSESDLFWIAQEYLHLPADLAPVSQLEEGYAEHKQKWEDREPIPASYSDFTAIKAGLRQATFDDDTRSDLLFWLDKMKGFLSSAVPRPLVRMASYELAVANLRGKNDLNPAASLVGDYFSDVALHGSIGDITDAAVLSTYCHAAFQLGQYEIDEAGLLASKQAVVDFIDSQLQQEEIGPGRRSGLLRVRGSLELTPMTPDTRPNLELACKLWNEMLDYVTDAPIYPIEEFSDYLGKILGHIDEHSEIFAIAHRADAILASRAGNAAAGNKAFDRAISFLERDDRLSAIRELHTAKFKWFSGEQLDGMIKVLLFLTKQYHEIGLVYAAKSYAMTAAYIARHENPQRYGGQVPEALFDLMDAEDGAGNSFGFLALFPVLLSAQIEFADDPLAFEKHPRLNENIGQLAALLGFLTRANPQARKVVESHIVDWPSEIIKPILDCADQPDGFWNEGSWDDAWTNLEQAMLDRPFGDIGRIRAVRWSALGVNWTCVFENDYTTTPVAEQIIAELQLITCAIAHKDLGIIPCAVTLRMSCSSGAARVEFSAPDQSGCEFDVTIPSADRGPDDISESVALFLTVIGSCSVYNSKVFTDLIDGSMLETMFTGRPYAELYREVVPAEFFAEELRAAAGDFEPERSFQTGLNISLAWFDRLAETYSETEAQTDIGHRYDTTQKSLQYTLPRLLKDEQVMARLLAMHDAGMKDWEILSILSNVAFNEKIAITEEPSRDEMMKLALKYMQTPELEQDAVSPDVFSQTALELHKKTYHAAILDGKKLNAPSCCAASGVERFLVARYRLREDDIEHDDIFGWAST